MRCLLQRVQSAQVDVLGETVGKIGPGLLLFLGIHLEDDAAQIPRLAERVAQLRIFGEERMDRSVIDVGGSVLVVSQFTLYGTCTKGRRPEFTQAAKGEIAKLLYGHFVERLREYVPVETGVFGAHMAVSLVNDGPVTLLLEG